MSIKLLVGLGNPGDKYAQTRHNAGRWLVESFAAHHRLTLSAEKKMQGECGSVVVDETPCVLLLPLVYMNQSGLSVRAVSQFYRITPQEILVAHDDLDLAPGRVKIKTGGGHGGHNGLRDIIAQLGSADFHRIRLGIGHPGDKAEVLNYVLGKPSLSDKHIICKSIEHVLQQMPLVFKGQFATVMNHLTG